MNTEQIDKISWRTYMVSSPTGLCSISAPMYLLHYPVLFNNKIMLRHWEYSKHQYSWHSLTTLDTANVRIILVPHMMIE